MNPPEPQILSVSELTRRVKFCLEDRFHSVWVQGETSQVRRQSSGHVYLTLKDRQAVLSAVVWRSTALRMRMEIKDGMEVLCRGSLDVYPPHGTYKLIIDRIEPVGEGALQVALRQLHEKLAGEGLFDPQRKRPLPRIPTTVALVTSPTGAAARDFLKVACRRWRGVRIVVVPTRVQGASAAGEIVAALRKAGELATPPEIVVLTRGGGSLEDMWCFNDERVVRAVAASPIPLVCGVGHEIDTSLSDLAADRRAATPSEAAELVFPSEDEIREGLGDARRRLQTALGRRFETLRARLGALAQRRVLRRPDARLRELATRLDESERRLRRAIEQSRDRAGQKTAALAARLESLSPLAVLTRGYSVTFREQDGRVVTSAAELSTGERIVTRFARGQSAARVEEVSPDP